MEESITTVFQTNREIFCIMNKVIHPSPPPIPTGTAMKRTRRVDYIPPSNYDWLPAKIEIDDRKRGRSINLLHHRFERYFEYVDKWDLTISISYGDKLGESFGERIAALSYQFKALIYEIKSIATNKSQKTIAGSLVKINPFSGEPQKDYGFIHLLPPPTKCDIYQAIEILLDLICGEQVEIVSPWRKSIQIPKIEELKNNLGRK